MTARGGRPSHVKPRPPSSGRPRAVRAAAPSVQRVRQHRGIEPRRRGLPIVTQALLALAVVALGAVVLLTAQGAIGPLVASVGGTLDDAFGKLVQSPAPSASVIVATDAPIIAAPDRPFTNQPATDLHVTVPVAVVGTTAKVRIYVALGALTPAPIREAAIGNTAQVDVPVQLAKGSNTFSATIVRDGVESPPSAPQEIVLDQVPPTLKISSPKDGATVDASKVTIAGTTQAGSQLIAQNTSNGGSVSSLAGDDGRFSLSLPVSSGPNDIQIQATDPAGNTTSATLAINEGTGKLHVSLTSSLYTFRLSHLPSSIRLQARVTDENGDPLAGASAAFVLQIPGLSPIAATVTTDPTGVAIFTSQLVAKPTVGHGLATVLVIDADFGKASDRVLLTFAK